MLSLVAHFTIAMVTVVHSDFTHFSNPDDIVRAKVPFSACREMFAGVHEVPDFYSTAVGKKVPAKK